MAPFKVSVCAPYRQVACSLLLLLTSLMWPFDASAACQFLAGSSKQTVNVTGITVSWGRDRDDHLYIPPPGTLAQPLKVTCDSSSDPYSIINARGADGDLTKVNFESGVHGLLWGWQSGPVPGGDLYYGRGTVGTLKFLDLASVPHHLILAKTPNAKTGGVIQPGLMGTLRLGGLDVLDLYLTSMVEVKTTSCTTPDVEVDLGTHRSSEFGGKDTFTPSATDFVIDFVGCQSGSYSISYAIRPVATPYNRVKGVLALDGAAGAKGVGIQLLQANGTTPVMLDQFNTFRSYGSVSGNYQLKLKARYYQTDAKINGGAVNATAILDIAYH